MTNYLLLLQSDKQETIDEFWIQRFVKQHFNLNSRFTHKYDYQWVCCEDSKIIQDWFELIKNTINKYEIVKQNIYNFDEIDFQMREAFTARVITRFDHMNKSFIIQSDNIEWMTVIKSINATDWILFFMIIMKRKLHQTSWYEELSVDWIIELSESD